MNNQELTELLRKLHDELDDIKDVDEKSLQLLRDLEKDIDDVLERSDQDSIVERLREAIREFEVTHPSITAMLSEISNILNNAGI